MKAFTSKKNLYLLALLVVTLLCGIIAPTYAKFVKEYTTTSDVAGVSLAFDIGITNIEEYEVITVPAGGADVFNVKVTNSSDSTLYYGIWYRMVEPTEKSSDVIIARVDGTTATTSGSLASNRSSTPSIVIINNSDTEITLNIGVASSNTSTSDIEYIGGKKLISGTYSVNYMNTTNGTNYFNSDTYRTYITNASFVDYIDTTNAALDENEDSIMWDMSSNQDNRIIAWLEENETTDEEGNKYYDLYIGSIEKIYAKSLASFFNSMSGLLSISFNSLDTSLTTNMNSMFENCSSIENLDLSSFDTSNVTSMNPRGYWSYGGMFHGCSSLKYLNISNWDVSNVTSFGNMFWNCNSLRMLDLSDWNTSNVTDMEKMFSKCNSLTTLNLENFNTSQVTTMTSMFQNCSSLTSLDLSNFNTSQVTTMTSMFQNCSSLTELNLSNFDTSSVTNMNGMFYYCTKLVTSLVIMNPSTTYTNIFNEITNTSSASITLYYVGDNPNTDVNESTEELVEAMIATRTGNIINGGCTGDYCTIAEG